MDFSKTQILLMALGAERSASTRAHTTCPTLHPYLKGSFLFLLFTTLLFCNLQAQLRYPNREYSTIHGLPVNLNWSSSLLTSGGELLTVGNTYTAGEESNLLLTKLDQQGNIIFQVEYDGPDHLEDYGIGAIEDGNGNYVVIGTSYTLASSSLDIVVLMYNSAGQLQWDYTFNGTASGDDVPAMAILLPNGDIALCGGTESNGTGADYITIRLDGSGNEVWASTYDYSGFQDGAIRLRYMPLIDRLMVTGGSGSAANVYDIAIASFNATNGSLANDFRTNFNVGIDQPTCFGADNAGNMYIGGYFASSPTDQSMSLVSVSDSLTYRWDTIHNVTSGEDRIMDMAVLGNGDIFVTGHVQRGGKFEAYTAKYDHLGNLVWEQRYLSRNGSAKAKRININSSGNLLVAGMVSDSTDTNMLVLEYDQNGKLLFSKEHDAGGAEVASTIESDFMGNIYLHGTTTVNGNGYITVKYSMFQREIVPVNDTVDSIDYVQNEIIVQVRPELVDTPAVDNAGKTFGPFSDFVKQEVINTINPYLPRGYDIGSFNTLKIFRKLRTSDTYSVTRSGDTIDMPPFWATFVVLLPQGLNELSLSAHIDTQAVSVLNYAHVNHLAYPLDLPNDDHFVNGNQNGLESSGSPENDINIDRAWDFQHGRNDVRVGIIDFGIEWSHIDLNITGAITNLSTDSKVLNGWDFHSNVSVFSTTDNDVSIASHGSKVAGIIGGIRNNDEGVAGIAGGDFSNGNFGVSLIDLKVADKKEYPVDKCYEAMIEGAKDVPSNPNNPGYACHIINASYGSRTYDETEASAVRFAYNNECLLVAAAGNKGKERKIYPSSYSDHMVMRIGASGINGDKVTKSNFGHQMDVIAPGHSDLVMSLFKNQTQYQIFDGTSAAAPHVAGVASLLISEVMDNWNPNPLEPEDMEQLMERYSSEVDGPNYQPESGWGRLNAGLVMEHMEWPFYWVEHFGDYTTNYATKYGFSGPFPVFRKGSTNAIFIKSRVHCRTTLAMRKF